MIVSYVILGFLWAWCVVLTVRQYNMETSLDLLEADLSKEKIERIKKEYENEIKMKDLIDEFYKQMRNN